jgi:hypothetical protein
VPVAAVPGLLITTSGLFVFYLQEVKIWNFRHPARSRSHGMQGSGLTRSSRAAVEQVLSYAVNRATRDTPWQPGGRIAETYFDRGAPSSLVFCSRPVSPENNIPWRRFGPEETKLQKIARLPLGRTDHSINPTPRLKAKRHSTGISASSLHRTTQPYHKSDLRRATAGLFNPRSTTDTPPVQ